MVMKAGRAWRDEKFSVIKPNGICISWRAVDYGVYESSIYELNIAHVIDVNSNKLFMGSVASGTNQSVASTQTFGTWEDAFDHGVKLLDSLVSRASLPKEFSIERCPGNEGADGYFNLFYHGLVIFSDLEFKCIERRQFLLSAGLEDPKFVEAIQLISNYTRGYFDVYDMAGPASSKRRQEVVSLLLGKKTPVAKCGVTFIRQFLFDKLEPVGSCLANREADLRVICKAILAKPVYKMEGGV